MGSSYKICLKYREFLDRAVVLTELFAALKRSVMSFVLCLATEKKFFSF